LGDQSNSWLGNGILARTFWCLLTFDFWGGHKKPLLLGQKNLNIAAINVIDKNMIRIMALHVCRVLTSMVTRE
jgi:hypothetical protein